MNAAFVNDVKWTKRAVVPKNMNVADAAFTDRHPPLDKDVNGIFATILSRKKNSDIYIHSWKDQFFFSSLGQN